MILNQDNTLFLMIDIQEKLLKAVFNKENLEKNANILAKASTILNLPLFITEQYPQGLGETIKELNISDKKFVKTDFSAINDSSLLLELKNQNRKQIVIFGIETHICVHQTAIDLLKEGFEVTLAIDASGTRSEFEHITAIEFLREKGVQIKSTEMILFELIKSSKNPKFKEIQNLIK